MIDDGYFSVCLNTDPYTFLGSRPLHLAPGTSVNGDLSVVTFESLALRTMLPVLVSALGKATIRPRHRHVSLVRGVSSATVKGYRPGALPARRGFRGGTGPDRAHLGRERHCRCRWSRSSRIGAVVKSEPARPPTGRPLAHRRRLASGQFSNYFSEKVCRRPLRGS